MFYNTSSKVKLPYHATLGVQRWWDNGSVPIWITAQRQVTLPPPAAPRGEGPGGDGAPRGKEPDSVKTQVTTKRLGPAHLRGAPQSRGAKGK